MAPPAQFIQGDVYHNVVAGFQIWWVAAMYILANLALGLHLYHGLWAMFKDETAVPIRFIPEDVYLPEINSR